MAGPFSRWMQRVQEAEDENARRRLIGELGIWRAGRLTDLPALRDTAYAISLLYAKVGDYDAASREVEAFLSLCRTPPEALQAEMRVARRHANAIRRAGEKVVRGEERRGRSQNEWGQAVQHVLDEQYGDARELIGGRKGVRARSFHHWVELVEALACDTDDERVAAVFAIEQRLRQRFVDLIPKDVETEVGPTPEVIANPESVLQVMLGRAVPSKREPLLQALADYLAEHPDQIDALAAAALRHHVDTAGPRVPAPWLAGFVGRALAETEAPDVRAAIGELSNRGAFSVSAYHEAAFDVQVGLLRRAMAEEWDMLGLRRGVLRRGEPRDRRMWTLRLVKDFKEGMIVVAPPSDEPYPPKGMGRLIGRIRQLCERVVLIATGPGNTRLREVAASEKISVLDEATAEQALEALAQATVVERRSPRADTAAKAKSGETPTAKPEGSSSPERDATQALRVAFEADEPATAEVLLPLVEPLSRTYKAFVAVRSVLSKMEASDADRRMAPLLLVAHQVAPPEVRLSEAITIGTHIAASVGATSAVRAMMTGDEVGSRYGGEAIGHVIDVMAHLSGEGWALRRVLRGVTRRESRTHAALEALGDNVLGLWRVLVRRADVDGEVWVLSSLSPEAQGAIPQLLLDDRQRAVVASAADADWVRSVVADALVLDEGMPGLVERLDAWTSTAPADSPA